MKKKLVIRLQRLGRINRPFFLIVVTHKEKSAQGSYLSKVGYYDPFMTKSAGGHLSLVVYKNLLNYWIARGAVPNEKVRQLLF